MRAEEDSSELSKKLSSTPQKDMSSIKNKFDPQNEVTIQNYSTLDNDYRRNRPIRGNHHSSLHSGGQKEIQTEERKYKHTPMLIPQEPTPQFSSGK